jgi:hypothetical protein
MCVTVRYRALVPFDYLVDLDGRVMFLSCNVFLLGIFLICELVVGSRDDMSSPCLSECNVWIFL